MCFSKISQHPAQRRAGRLDRVAELKGVRGHVDDHLGITRERVKAGWGTMPRRRVCSLVCGLAAL